jgi:hypothetical protein
MGMKIKWITAEGRFRLAARRQLTPPGWDQGWTLGITEADMDPVQAWCREHDCGRRMSFDTFQFRNRREITLFLLRWAS